MEWNTANSHEDYEGRWVWADGEPTAEREQHTKASHRWIKICASKRGTQWGKICVVIYRMRKKDCIEGVAP